MATRLARQAWGLVGLYGNKFSFDEEDYRKKLRDLSEDLWARVVKPRVPRMRSVRKRIKSIYTYQKAPRRCGPRRLPNPPVTESRGIKTKRQDNTSMYTSANRKPSLRASLKGQS